MMHSTILYYIASWYKLNSSPPRQNGHHLAGYIFRCIFVNEQFWILIKISFKFISKGLIDNNQALVQIMAWHQMGDKPLSEPMLTQFKSNSFIYKFKYQSQHITLQKIQLCFWTEEQHNCFHYIDLDIECSSLSSPNHDVSSLATYIWHYQWCHL